MPIFLSLLFAMILVSCQSKTQEDIDAEEIVHKQEETSKQGSIH